LRGWARETEKEEGVEVSFVKSLRNGGVGGEKRCFKNRGRRKAAQISHWNVTPDLTGLLKWKKGSTEKF